MYNYDWKKELREAVQTASGVRQIAGDARNLGLFDGSIKDALQGKGWKAVEDIYTIIVDRFRDEFNIDEKWFSSQEEADYFEEDLEVEWGHLEGSYDWIVLELFGDEEDNFIAERRAYDAPIAYAKKLFKEAEISDCFWGFEGDALYIY